MSEQNPRKSSSTSPSPFNLAILLIAIASGVLIVGLLASGAFGNFSSQPSILKQAQAGESPTSETVETLTQVPTSDQIATLEPYATLVVTETATVEISSTPTETTIEPSATSTEEPTVEPSATLVIETPTVFIEPTQTGLPPTVTPTTKPSKTVAPSATRGIATDTPEAETEAILFESGGTLYEQPTDGEGNPRDSVTQLVSKTAVQGRVLKLIPSPNGKYIYFIVRREPNCTDCELIEVPYILYQGRGEILELDYPLPKIFGWHPNGVDLIFGDDGGTVGLFNVENKEIHSIIKVQQWLNVPWEPIVYGIAYSPDGNQIIASFGLTGRGIGHQAWIANADGSAPKRVIENEGPIFDLAWSPNGQNIAFLAKGLEIIQSDGQHRRTVSRNFSVGFGFAPRWSPDGRSLAFEAYEELPPNSADDNDEMQKLFQYHKIHILEVQTNTETRLIADELGGEINPAWSPDGRRIAFLSNRSGPIEIWIADINGQTLHELTFDGQPKRGEVIWQPISGR